MGDRTRKEILIAGAATVFAIDLLVYPLDTMKTRIQSRDLEKLASGLGTAGPEIGLRGLYQGIGSLVLATLPAGKEFLPGAVHDESDQFSNHHGPTGVFFLTYEWAKSAYGTTMQFSLFEALRRRGRGDNGSGLLRVGLVNGPSAAVATTPLDVVKTRIMLSGDGDDVQRRRPRQGGLGVAHRLLEEEGIQALFRGGVFRAIWTALGSGLYLGTYEVAKKGLGHDSGREREDV